MQTQLLEHSGNRNEITMPLDKQHISVCGIIKMQDAALKIKQTSQK